MKKIVIKMRSMKKMVGDDLLKLALMLSLLKVDPQAYLGWSSPQSSGDPGGSVDSGETWTQAMLHNPWIPDNGITSAPSIHPKSLDSMLERHQQEILEDLNSLGRYSRLSAYGGVPVHISAFIVDTDQGPSCCQPEGQDWGEESDSGISDTAHSDSDDENIEKEKNPEESEEEEVAMDLECETILFDSASPLSQVQGLDTVMGLTPPPENSLLDLGAGQDALEAELVHIDEQLMNIEDDLGHIDEAFVMMDQQLAESISEDVYDNPGFATEDGFGLNLDTLGVDSSNEELGNPFDEWQRDALADIEELALDSVDTEVPANVHTADPLISSQEVLVDSSASSNEMGSILRDPDLFPTDQANSGSAILEDFDEDLFGGSNLSKVGSRSEQVVRQDVALPQMEMEVTRANLLPRRPTPPSVELREESVDKELLEQVSMAEVEEEDEDLIMRVLRESNIDFDEIPLTTEDVKEEEVKVEMLKEEEIKEEVIDVEEVGFELSLTDGASAKVEIDYDKLHEDIKSNFESADDGSEVAEFTLDSFDGQSPSQHAFHHDHNYLGGSSKEGPAILGERSAAATRRRNASESSGYSSMAEDQASISSRCRDEKMAKKMNLPFSTWEVINSPVDTFSEMLARPGLTSDQVKLCRDIRRRGKNKVAAQNCRKRKLDTIEELQSQVGQVQRRKAQLLREREQLEAERARWSSKLSYLEETVLAGAGKSFGMFTLEVTDNAVVVTSRLTKPGLLAAAVGGAEKQPRGGRSRD